MDAISIRGARTHNLKNISVDLPRRKLIVLTGLSGSGKSSLAFDTLYAEGQRRYVESLSAYARQFLQMMDKPDVDVITGLSPAIAIEQKTAGHNPRSTVGTVTEIHDYLRLLYARVGTPYCPDHDLALRAQSVSQMVDQVLSRPEDTRVALLAPVARARNDDLTAECRRLQALGFVRVRINGAIQPLDGGAPLAAPDGPWNMDVVVDRLRVRPDSRQRLAESFETALELAQGRALVLDLDTAQEQAFSAAYACPVCARGMGEMEPRLFSFNNPAGACPTCNGLGQVESFDPARVVAFPELSLAAGAIHGWDRRNAFSYAMMASLARHYGFDLDTPYQALEPEVRERILHGSGDQEIAFQYLGENGIPAIRRHAFEGIVPNLERRWRETHSNAVREELGRLRHTILCPDCHGARLCAEARNVLIGQDPGQGERRGRALYEIEALSLSDCRQWFLDWAPEGARRDVADRIMHEIRARLDFLVNVGLGYLSLDRGADTLSGGEAQRIRLAAQLGSNLQGVCYVLDEPTIGLHPRDNRILLDALARLEGNGNTLVVVEHDEDTIRRAGHVIDIGPGAGIRGGMVVAQGTVEEITRNPASITGRYLREPLVHPMNGRRVVDAATPSLEIVDATRHNLRQANARIPLGRLNVITGVSGSGKSTLARDVLLDNLAQRVGNRLNPGAWLGCRTIRGWEAVDRVLEVDQTPIGKTPRSCPATYVGFWDDIRKLYAGTRESRLRGWTGSRFSFNTGDGRCPECEGQGMRTIEMSFLPDVKVPCDACHGARFNQETLGVQWNGRSAGDVLRMEVDDAIGHFSAHRRIARALQLMQDVGLGYLTLGQPSPTLSGGEAQRIKLVTELTKAHLDEGVLRTGRASRIPHTLYVLDEPTVGLSTADVEKLIRVLHRLADAGHTVVVIEHNLDIIAEADWIVDLGPEGGDQGGRVVAQGSPEQLRAGDTHTGRILAEFLA